jgi:4-hydroxybenzoyl-CoA reductase subunit beta
MSSLAPITLLRPASLAEAAQALARPGANALAGGTDLIPNLRRGLGEPSCLVDLGRLPGLDRIERGGNTWRLGAGVTLATIERDAAIANELPALAQAAAAVAGPGHRSAATIGGNLCQDTRCVYYNQSAWWRAANQGCLKLAGDTCHVAPQGKRCHAAFASDLAAALLAYRAEVEIVGDGSARRLPLAQLYRDDGAAHLTLAAGELVAAVVLQQPAEGAASAYRKVRVRGAMDFPLAGVAVRLRLQHGRLADLAVGITGTNSFALQLEGTEALLGKPVDDAALAALAKLVRKQVSPMRSTVTSSNHRRLVAVATATRLVRELAAR